MEPTASKTILVIGGGGREHALVWKLAQSPKVSKLFVAPGNGGTATIAENVAIKADDIEGLVKFTTEKKVDLVVVGPDDPLASGIVDTLQAAGVKVFGPTRAAAQIEASKAFSKNLMAEMQVPTAAYQVFTDAEQAKAYARGRSLPIVVKASGLALGKGVIICHTSAEAEQAIDDIMTSKVFGAAGNEVVVEDFLTGQEISIHAVSDGNNYVLFPTAQDHKAIGEGDTGLNTGGMGTIAPLPWVTPEQMRTIDQQVVAPILAGLVKHESPFSGCLYPGIIMTAEGPKVLEYNARFGDPETQSYMRLLDSDLFDLAEASADGLIGTADVRWKDGFAACIVLASGGYPGNYKKGLPISGIQQAEQDPDVVVFHAGTSFDQNGTLVTSGGRVLNVTATAPTLQEALDKAYNAVQSISFEGMYYRKDIGAKALK